MTPTDLLEVLVARALSVCVWVTLVAVSACGGAARHARPPQPVPPASPGPTAPEGTWHGTVASTPALEFGGPPYCSYTVQFTELASAVRLAGGRVSAAKVTALHVERSLRNCPHPVIAPNLHTYTLNNGSVVGRKVAIRYDADRGNNPLAVLEFDGELSDDEHTIAGTFTLQRADAGAMPAVHWRVRIPVTMRR